MRKAVRRCFSKAHRVIDRFHIQKPAFEATQEIRIKHRREAIQEETDQKENSKCTDTAYEAKRFENGDTRRELPAGSRYLLFKSGGKWTEKQRRQKSFSGNIPT